MKVYEFGKPEAPVLLLLPGTCCHWKTNFERVIPLLTPDFRVVCISYDGFDETESTIFPDMLEETGKIEAWINRHYGGRIFAAYGCSLGGSFVSLLVQRKNIHIRHAILGSSDLDQVSGLSARAQAWLITKVMSGIFQKGRLPSFIQKRKEAKPADKKEYYDRLISMMGMDSTRMAFVKPESIHNQFYWDLVTPVEQNLSIPGTTVHCFYASGMGEKYLNRYHQHFSDPDIRTHPLEHEELLLCFPEKWAAEVRSCCGTAEENHSGLSSIEKQ